MKSKEYQEGYDCGLNGPNTKNCHFALFSTPEKTIEWERGKKAGAEKRIIMLNSGTGSKRVRRKQSR